MEDDISDDLEVFLAYGFNGKQLDDLDDDSIGFYCEEDDCQISNSSKFLTAFSTTPADQFQEKPINDHWGCEILGNTMEIVADCECGHPGCVFQSSLYSEADAKVTDNEDDLQICVNSSSNDFHQCNVKETFSYFYYNSCSEFETAQMRKKRKFIV